MPGFRPESLYVGGSARGLRGYVQPLRNILQSEDEEQAATFDVLSAESPDGRYKLVFDWYQSVGEKDGVISIGGEPDSAPLLLDLRDSTSNQFESCGTPCGFDWGAWLAPDRFVLGGWTEIQPPGSGYRGTLDVYSIPDSTRYGYITRPISEEAFSRYRHAWEQWVGVRFRARKRQAASDRSGPAISRLESP